MATIDNLVTIYRNVHRLPANSDLPANAWTQGNSAPVMMAAPAAVAIRPAAARQVSSPDGPALDRMGPDRTGPDRRIELRDEAVMVVSRLSPWRWSPASGGTRGRGPGEC